MARNTSNNAPENKEASEKQKNQNQELLQKAQKQFVDKKLLSDHNYFKTHRPSFKNFLGYLNLQPDNLSQLAITLSESNDGTKKVIEKQILKYLVLTTAPREKTLDTVIKVFHSNYQLSDQQKSKLDQKIEKLSISDLKKLLEKEKNRLDFLVDQKIVRNKQDVEFTQTTDFFRDFNITDQQLKQLEKKSVDLHQIHQYFTSQYVGDFEKPLLDFFEIITIDQKRQFLFTFFQSAPFSVLEKAGLVDNKTLKELLKKTSNDYNPNFSDDEIDTIVEHLDKTNFYVPIDFSGIDEQNFQNIIQSEEFLGELNGKISKEKEFVNKREAVVDKLELADLQDYPKVLKDFISGSDKIEKFISDAFAKTKSGDYIKTYNTHTKTPSFFKINRLIRGNTPETATVEIEDKTYKGYLRPAKQGAKHSMTYPEFIRFLEGISTVSNQGDNQIEKSDLFGIITQQNISEGEQEVLPESHEITSKQQLKQHLDDIDGDNKGVSIDKMSFVIGNGDAKGTPFTVTFSDNSQTPVTLDNGVSMSYTDFLESFKHFECKRFQTVSTGQELLDAIENSGSEVAGKYKGLKYKDGKIIQENGDDKKPTTFNLFISEQKDSNQSVYYDDLKSETFFIGKFKQEKQGSDFTPNSKGKVKGLSDLYQQIIQNGLVPHSTDEVEADKDEDGDKFNQTGSFLKRAFKGASIAELIGAFKVGIDAVSQNLERGSKLKSAKLAMKIAGVTGKKGDLYTQMQQVVEAENKKQMEDISGQLKVLDSNIMIGKVIKIIENRDSEEYEKEAALMTIVGKYGTLYPKDIKNDKGEKFCDRRSQLIWYRALGGQKNDALYLKQKAMAEEDNVAFTEERLVEALLKEQKEPPYNRRSKLHKDFGSALNGGMDDEKKDGANKTGDMATLSGRVNYVVNSMAEGEVVNGTGGLDNIIGANGDRILTAKAPFVYTITNLAQDVHQGLNKSNYFGKGFGVPYTAFLFNEKQSARDIYFNAVKQVVEDFNDTKMSESFNKIGVRKGNVGIPAASSFWDKYGKKLYDRLQCQDGYIYGKVAAEIKPGDPDYNKKKKQKEIYSDYFKHMSGLVNCEEYSFTDDFINDGRYNADNSNLLVLGINRMVENKFELNNDGIIKSNSEKLLSQSLRALEKILENDDLTLEEKKANYLHVFRPLWAVAHKLYKAKSGKCPFIETLKHYGMDVYGSSSNPNIFNEDDFRVKQDPKYDDVSGNDASLGIAYMDTSAYKDFCNNQVERFFNERLNEKGEIIYKKDVNDSQMSDDTQNVIDIFKNATQDTMQNEENKENENQAAA